MTLIIQAAHAFGLAVVAEGVENDETLETLHALGCDTAQGFLVSRPMPPDEVAPWLAARRAGRPS